MARIRMSPGQDPLSVEQNFTRIENATEALLDVVRGKTTFTGTVTLITGLARVDSVVVSLAIPPVAAACFVTASSVAPNSIVLTAYGNGFGVSAGAVTVEWIAAGEMILG